VWQGVFAYQLEKKGCVLSSYLFGYTQNEAHFNTIIYPKGG
jgi:hypothetical protein